MSGVTHPNVPPHMDLLFDPRQRSLSNGKPTRKVTGAASRGPGVASLRRGSDKRRISTTMYVLRDAAKSTRVKDKSTYMLVPKRDDQQLSDKSFISAAASGTEISEEEIGCIQLFATARSCFKLWHEKIHALEFTGSGIPEIYLITKLNSFVLLISLIPLPPPPLSSSVKEGWVGGERGGFFV
ncbi:hypothetical protein U1Q18_035509 [Sarracenia purpurea var. burkii]